MMLTGEFYMIETAKSDAYSSFIIIPSGQKGDPRANYQEEAEYNKKVRLMRCEIVEVMEEQT